MNDIMGHISAIEEDKCMESVELIAFDGLNQIGDINSEDEIEKLNNSLRMLAREFNRILVGENSNAFNCLLIHKGQVSKVDEDLFSDDNFDSVKFFTEVDLERLEEESGLVFFTNVAVADNQIFFTLSERMGTPIKAYYFNGSEYVTCMYEDGEFESSEPWEAVLGEGGEPVMQLISKYIR